MIQVVSKEEGFVAINVGGICQERVRWPLASAKISLSPFTDEKAQQP